MVQHDEKEKPEKVDRKGRKRDSHRVKDGRPTVEFKAAAYWSLFSP